MERVPIRSISCAAVILGFALGPGLDLCSRAAAQQTPPAQAPSGKPPAVKPSETPAEAAPSNMIGLDVFSSDGTRVGEVRGVKTGPGGAVTALHVRTGGFLGFGGRLVIVPQGRFTRTGRSVRLDLDSAQVSGLPGVKE